MINQYHVFYLKNAGLRVGTDIENQTAFRLHRWKLDFDMQYKVDKYTLDFAFPDVKVCLEIDGPFHLSPGGAVRDIYRDMYLQENGWLVFRLRALGGLISEDQLFRVVDVVNLLRKDGYRA